MSNVPIVADMMQKNIFIVRADTEIMDIIDGLLSHKISGAPVVEGDDRHLKIIGMITEKDCLKVLINDSFYGLEVEHHVAKDYMSKEVLTVREDEHLSTTANTLIQNVFRRIPVVNERQELVGVIGRDDILKGIQFLSQNNATKKGYLSEEMKAKLR